MIEFLYSRSIKCPTCGEFPMRVWRKRAVQCRECDDVDTYDRNTRRDCDLAERAAFHAEVRRSIDFPQVFDIPGVDA